MRLPGLAPISLAAALTAALTAVGITLAARSLPAADDDAGPPAVQPALAVVTQALAQDDGYHHRRAFTGRVEAARASALGFEQAGKLAKVLVQEGEPVTRGQLLARQDAARLQARSRELEAALAEAQAGLALAQASYRRIAQVVDQGHASRQGLDEARQGRRQAQARVTRVQRQLQSLAVDLDKTRLTAPFDGVVVARPLDPGRVLAAGAPVLTLQEATTPQVRVGVAGRLAKALVPGRNYRLRWQGQTLSARLRAVLPVRSLPARTVGALFELPQAPAGLRPGDLVRLPLAERVRQPGFWLPATALTEARRGLWGVYVLSVPEGPAPAGLAASHRVQRQLVEVLYQDGDRVYLQGTLNAGDRVVVDGVHRIVPGQWVRTRAAPQGPLVSDGGGLVQLGGGRRDG